MKCPKCGVEYSDKVCRIHIKTCNPEPVKENPQDTKKESTKKRDMLKEELDRKNIPYHANAKNEYLMKLINESKEDKEAV